MKTAMRACAIIAVLGIPAYAQDHNVKSKISVKGDDAKAVVMQGCLGREPGTNLFLLSGAIAGVGDQVQSETQRKTDVDDDKTTVKEKTKTKVDDGKAKVLSTGPNTTYELLPRPGVDLIPYVGRQVEITALAVDPSKGNDTAKVKIKEETKVDRENAPDAKSTTETKAELPRGPHTRLTAISARQIGTTCAAY
jgi:hypothetical protein